MARISIHNIKKSFANVDVLHNLNLTVADGEFVALVGPSGCGKSTLLRILAGLDEPSKGEVRINDEWVNDWSPKERNVAMVFQSYALYPHMNVEQNIGFNLRISGVSKSEIQSRVQATAELLNLSDFLKRKPSQLSGGQRQRVAMGRALVRNPDVFLFDEPLSNLDAKLRVQMREEIKRLHQSVKTTSVYVTHDQIEAMTLADRVVILNNGRIEQIGSPTELYRNPANAFVASFIGTPSMNFLAGKVININAATNVSIEVNKNLSLTSTRQTDIALSSLVQIGIRPEHLNIGDGPNAMQGVLELIEPTGAQNHLKVRIGNSLLTVIDPLLTELAIGDALTVNVSTDWVYLFTTNV